MKPTSFISILLLLMIAVMACKKENPTVPQPAVGFAVNQLNIDLQAEVTSVNIPILFPASNVGWSPFIIEFNQPVSTAVYGEQFAFPTMLPQNDTQTAFYDPNLAPDNNMEAQIPMTVYPDKITTPTQIVLQAAYGYPVIPQLIIRLNPVP